MFELSETEKVLFQRQLRFEVIFNLLHWSLEFRQINRLLICLDPDEGISARAVARRCCLSRGTVRRRVTIMLQRKLLDSAGFGLRMSEVGRGYFILMHREVLQIATGHQVGLSGKMQDFHMEVWFGNPSDIAALKKSVVS